MCDDKACANVDLNARTQRQNGSSGNYLSECESVFAKLLFINTPVLFILCAYMHICVLFCKYVCVCVYVRSVYMRMCQSGVMLVNVMQCVEMNP